MILPTLFSAHAPAARHRARRAAAGLPAPAVTLSPLDAFLLTRFAEYLPQPVTVLDLAADATDGDSVVVLRGASISVIAPRRTCVQAPCPDWRPLVEGGEMHARSIEPRLGTGSLTLLDARVDDDTDGWRRVRNALPIGGTTLVLLAETDETVARTGQHLAKLADIVPEAPILLLPLGMTGESELLVQTLAAHSPGGKRRFVALRERTPFFASSELGLLYPCDDDLIAVSLERLTGLVDGNFQFLSLMRDLVTATEKVIAIEARIAQIQQEKNDFVAQTEEAFERTEEAYARTNAARAEAEKGFLRAEAAFEAKSRYAAWLEERIRYYEEELVPWKNEVLTGMETELRNLHASKFVRADRLVRRLVRRGRR